MTNKEPVAKVLTDKPEDIKVNHISWDEYFMSIAILSALRSKDPNTKVGAAIISPDHKVLSLGYNGMPSGIDDAKVPWSRTNKSDLDNKYLYVCHAELNAILNSNKDIRGSILYVTLFPCNECAKAIIQAGIKEMVFMDDKYHDTDIEEASRKLLTMAGIKQKRYTGRIPAIDFGSIKYVPQKK